MDLSLLVLRLVVGAFLAGHGAQKLFGVLGGGGPEGTAKMFDNIGLRPGALHARAAGTAELLGGLLLGLGLSGIGPGAWSLDNAFGFDLSGTGWALAALAAGLLGGGAAVLSGRTASGRAPHPIA